MAENVRGQRNSMEEDNIFGKKRDDGTTSPIQKVPVNRTEVMDEEKDAALNKNLHRQEGIEGRVE